MLSEWFLDVDTEVDVEYVYPNTNPSRKSARIYHHVAKIVSRQASAHINNTSAPPASLASFSGHRHLVSV
jgi:hypothetical protein